MGKKRTIRLPMARIPAEPARRGCPPAAAQQKASHAGVKATPPGPSAHKSQTAVDNRANQLNPYHAAYWQSRGIAPGPVETVYHGTSSRAAEAIKKFGFKPSKDGMLGAGVYVTPTLSKAEAFAGKDGEVVKLAANMGNVKVVDARAAREHGFSETAWQKKYDAAFVPQGEGVKPPEFCVREPLELLLWESEAVAHRFAADSACSAS
mmetsp:Transcript_24787/g.57594  ORF Transcript_24787/g.57594 Transcript_24787/m.57594 type:complete len:207 (+) Transcript_24787:198-818(+)